MKRRIKVQKKFWYQIGTSAEGESYGYVLLTPREAKIVSYATNKENWQGSEIEDWSGYFWIDLDNPIPYEKGKGIELQAEKEIKETGGK